MKRRHLVIGSVVGTAEKKMRVGGKSGAAPRYAEETARSAPSVELPSS